MDIKAFAEERNKALLSLDKAQIDDYCQKYEVKLPEDEAVYWIGVHKSISALKGLSSADRKKQLQSVKWLMVRGYEHFMADITPDELIEIALESANEES